MLFNSGRLQQLVKRWSPSSSLLSTDASGTGGGIRGDTLVAICIPLGCAALLAEAYFRTDLADAEPANECACVATSSLVTHSHVRDLERNGMVVIPDALERGMLHRARQEVQRLQNDACFETSGNDKDVRQDQIVWLSNEIDRGEEGDNKDKTARPGLNHCIQLVRGVANALERHGYDGSYDHKVPLQCQLATYQGDGKALYHRHLDRCASSMTDLGLLNWLRLSDYRSRVITVILYLNESDRPKSNGGALRCWFAKSARGGSKDYDEAAARGTNDAEDKGEDGSETFVDIQPNGGTLVIFKSNVVEHMVVPSKTDRFALTSWISGTLP